MAAACDRPPRISASRMETRGTAQHERFRQLRSLLVPRAISAVSAHSALIALTSCSRHSCSQLLIELVVELEVVCTENEVNE